MILLLGLAFCCGVTAAQKKDDLPPWAYHSPIPAKERIAAVDRLGKLLRSHGYGHAADVLKRDATVIEPLGEDKDGSSSFRFLTAAKRDHWFGVMPVYDPDGKVDHEIRELLEARGDPAVGMASDKPIVYVRVNSKHLVKHLPDLAEAIKMLDNPH